MAVFNLDVEGQNIFNLCLKQKPVREQHYWNLLFCSKNFKTYNLHLQTRNVIQSLIQCFIVRKAQYISVIFLLSCRQLSLLSISCHPWIINNTA